MRTAADRTDRPYAAALHGSRGTISCWPRSRTGELPRRQVFKLHVTDPAGEAQLAAKTPRRAPANANWKCLDLTPQYNGDVRTIFQQQISLAPAENLFLASRDGRLFGLDVSPVGATNLGNRLPAIDLANLQNGQLPLDQRRIITPQNVPFLRFPETIAARNIAFTSLWDNWPRAVSVPVKQTADTAWLLVCGSTFPMQTRIANAEMRFRYADGQIEKLELVPPLNFWTLCPWGGIDYNYEVDGFCLPKEPPPTVQLGNNCRAMVLSWKLRPGVKLEEITLETLSQEVVIGLMGVSLMNIP